MRGTGKSSMVKAVFMAEVKAHPQLRLVEVDRDHVAVLPDLFHRLRNHSEKFVVLCDDPFLRGRGAAAKSLRWRWKAGSRARPTTCCSWPPPTAAT